MSTAKIIDALSFSDGQLKMDESILRLKKLDNLLGVKRKNIFGTTSLSEFKEKIDQMTNTDLIKLCNGCGRLPTGSRHQIKDILIREFKLCTAGVLSS